MAWSTFTQSNNYSLSCGFVIVRQPLSPGEFLATQRRYLQIMWLDNCRVDIQGQLASGQFATAALLARAVLDRGIAIYLLERGEAGVNCQNLWAMFRRVAGRRSRLFTDATRLVRCNPDTDDDVRSYAAACMEFVERRLGVDAEGYHSKESFAAYISAVQGVGRLASLLRS